jgi:exonuclease SbcD
VYDQRARAVVGALTADRRPEAVNLLVAHLMVAGGAAGGGERSAHTIFEYAVGAHAFPATLSYVALGHLHRVQRVPGPAPAWYSGSPLQLDFGETADRKAALLIDVAPGLPAIVQERPLSAGRRLRTLRGTMEEIVEAEVGDEHLRVVLVGEARAGLAEEVRSRFPDVLEVAVERGGTGSAHPRADAPARLGRPPTELFAEYLQDRGAADERVVALFADLLDEVEAD